jgi:2-C-methyl-D-erythritol 4-phosphate cytidylyltransferase
MSVAAVVVAAGRGVRFGGPKQFAQLRDDTVSAHSIRAARSVATRVVLVVPSNYDGDGEGADQVVVGGPTRAASVRAGLAQCADADVIVVHDAARPMATPALFAAVVDAVNAGADAAVPGLAISDTVKRVVHEGSALVVEATVPRDELVTVQTPQAFRRDALIRAHADADDATDDAALVESLGGRVVVVPGEVDNIKITLPGDLDKVAANVGGRR